MIQILLLAALALLIARIARAPKRSWRFILAGALALMAATQLLPDGNPYRTSVAGSGRALGWLVLILIPIALYAFALRHLRRRNGLDADHAPRAKRVGLVQILEDDALRAVTSAKLTAEAEAPSRQGSSLAWRAEDGSVAGHLALRLRIGLAEIEMLHVDPAHRRTGIARRLCDAAAEQAREMGMTAIGAWVAEGAAREAFARMGFAPAHSTGARSLAWMERGLA